MAPLIGYASRDITPPLGLELTGYGYFLERRAEAIADPLTARCLALAFQGRLALIFSLDLLALPSSFVARIRGDLARWGIAPEAVMLHCTHTHSGPAVRPLRGCGRVNAGYVDALARALVEVGLAAMVEARPARGQARFEGPAPARIFNRAGGPAPTPRVAGLRFTFEDAPPIRLLNAACHPVLRGRDRAWSADYCGAAMAALEAAGERPLLLNGCCGDLNPLPEQGAEAYGRGLAAAALAAPSRPMQISALRAARVYAPLEVGPAPPLPADAYPGARRVEAAWRARLDGRPRPPEIQSIDLGALRVIGLGAEVFSTLGAQIRGDRPWLLAGTTNGVIGYIADEADQRRGGYASTRALHIYDQPPLALGAGARWAEGAARALEAAHAQALHHHPQPRRRSAAPRLPREPARGSDPLHP